MGKIIFRIGILFCLGSYHFLNAMQPGPFIIASSEDELSDNQEDTDISTCPHCKKVCKSGTSAYGCLHEEHPLCLYESLSVQGLTNDLLGLINPHPSTIMRYTCDICQKKCMLDFFARHRLYRDCLKTLTGGNLLQVAISLLELPRHLASRAIHEMSQEGRFIEFQNQLKIGVGWQFLAKLPPNEWETYLLSLPKNAQISLRAAMPAELKCMWLEPKERCDNFEKQSRTTKQQILRTLWPDLPAPERTHYLALLLEEIDQAQENPIEERAALFTELIANHLLSPTEISSLLGELLETISAPQRFEELAYFFIPLLNSKAVYLCAEKIFDYLPTSEKAMLLSCIVHRLDTEKEECDLLRLAIDGISSTKEFHELIDTINDLSPMHAQRWTNLLIDEKAKNIEDAASLLLDLWDSLDVEAKKKLAKMVLKKNITSAKKLRNTSLLLQRITPQLAYLYAKKICSQSDSTKTVAHVLKKTYRRLNLERRLKIVDCVCRNVFLQPSPEQLACLVAAIPRDTLITYLPTVFQKLPLAGEQAQFLVCLTRSFSPKQRTILAKEFAQKHPQALFPSCNLITTFGIAHMSTYNKSQSPFYDFFNTLKPVLDQLFAVLTDTPEAPLFEDLWPLIPQNEQQRYFSHMPPKKREAFCDYFLGKDDELKSLIAYQKNLTTWWLNRPEEEKLAFWDAVPPEAGPNLVKKAKEEPNY